VVVNLNSSAIHSEQYRPDSTARITEVRCESEIVDKMLLEYDGTKDHIVECGPFFDALEQAN